MIYRIIGIIVMAIGGIICYCSKLIISKFFPKITEDESLFIKQNSITKIVGLLITIAGVLIIFSLT